jgi:flagellin-like hook-associated protein FlgL
VGIFTNNGVGAFSHSATIAGTTNNRAEFFDLNNDGNLDIASQGVTTLQLVTYLGNGNGSFRVHSTVSLTSGAVTPLVGGDFNNDGVIDLFTLNRTLDQLIVYRNVTKLASAHSMLVDVNALNLAEVLDILDGAQTRLLDAHSRFSLIESQIHQRVDWNLLLSESLTDAHEIIQSPNYALELAELTRLQIIQQAQMAARTQATYIKRSLVLSLLEILDDS